MLLEVNAQWLLQMLDEYACDLEPIADVLKHCTTQELYDHIQTSDFAPAHMKARVRKRWDKACNIIPDEDRRWKPRVNDNTSLGAFSKANPILKKATFYLDKNLARMLRDQAREENQPVSAIVNEVLASHLKED